MKRPSLVFQTKEVLSPLFDKGFGKSKHRDKKNTPTEKLIYSRGTYNNLMETCCNFVNYCKNQYKIRYLKEIQPNYFTEFIKTGNNGKGYSTETIKSYKWAVKRLQDGYNLKFKDNCVWFEEIKNIVPITEKIKQQMPKSVHDEIIKNAYLGKYENGLAFDLARNLGLRVSEIPNLRMNDFSFDKKGNLQSIFIHRSKGGRSRKIQSTYLTKKQIDTCLKVYDYFKPLKNSGDRLFLNKSQSYQRTFERIRNKISEDYKFCGVHSMRKEFAKDFYRRELAKGKKPNDVKKVLTQILGHNRVEILKSYL